MNQYPAGFSWDTQNYRCSIMTVDTKTGHWMIDGVYVSHHWFNHVVEWKSKRDGKTSTKNMSYLKLKKEFKRVGVDCIPYNPNHFDTDLFEV
jgi:hypothetical protein